MKRKILCTIGMTVILFSGCALKQDRPSYIGAESAKQTALKAAALSEEEVNSVSTDMNTRDGLDFYQVCFEAGGRSYQYEIDALTGELINAESSEHTGSDQGSQDGPLAKENPTLSGNTDKDQTGQTEKNDFQGTDQIAPEDSSPRQSSNAVTQTASDSDAYIGEDEARRIALEHAGLEEDQVTFVSSLLELDDGQWQYDVEFYTANYQEYDYEIDAYTGAVSSFDFDAENYSPQPQGSDTLTAEEAQQLALAQVPGASVSDIREFKLDDDDGTLLYEGEIIYNNTEYEFEIDAYSGFIREWSAEPLAHH